MSIGKSIKISVCMITYGHEDYIKKAIEGVLMQEVNFEVELIVADDCSPDQTCEIVKSIQNNHSNGEWIKYTKHKKNRGMMPNFIWALEQCKGKYIALCEGDDYWTDPLKLQKQVDFLEENPSINICFTKANVLSNGVFSKCNIDQQYLKMSFSFKVLLANNNFVITATVMFRNPKPLEFPNWFYKLPYGDMGLYKLLSNGKSLYGLSDTTAVYRVHDKGLYSGVNKLKSRRNYLSFYKQIYPYLSIEEKAVSQKKIKALKNEIIELQYSKNKWMYCFFKVKNSIF